MSPTRLNKSHLDLDESIFLHILLSQPLRMRPIQGRAGGDQPGQRDCDAVGVRGDSEECVESSSCRSRVGDEPVDQRLFQKQRKRKGAV